ncbi:hypothetical protein [Nostoc piscinale]|uniref:hypothetical protein n=1 Tax=Nostoc piscinale TaxID=224012 RepID=UPI000A445672|nr:hypothetical protein [Nostoc piscinale]
MFISDDRLRVLADETYFLDCEISYLVRLLREVRFFREQARSPLNLFCYMFDFILCARMITLKSPPKIQNSSPQRNSA